ncbi:MAG: hypothetical protein KBC11_01110 [Candidatus Pacebacteria bacterium]|nr:hypothetical protein [Candidatus Paceibacterota bacterium]
MITTLIISAAIILYWLSGFLPGRAIKPKNNRWHAWGPFDQIWGYIDGDKKSFLTKSMPWPFNKVFKSLTYNKFVENLKIEDLPKKSKDGKTIRYGTVQQILGTKKPIITITEEVTRLRKTETHPYAIEVILPKAGGTFYLVFTVKVEILNPMKTNDMDDFLIFVGNQLNDAIYPWAVKWEKTLASINIATNPSITKEELQNLIIDEMIGLNIDDDNSIMLNFGKGEINLRKYMNKVIQQYGGYIPDFSLDVGYDDKIESILKIRNEKTVETEKVGLQEKKNKTRDKEREKEKADELQIIELGKKKLEDVTVPLLQAQADAHKKINKGFKAKTLVLGDTKTSLLLNPNQGGGNV